MKQKSFLLFLSVFLVFAGCKDNNDIHSEHSDGAYYTCPMHPSVRNNSPGSCPVCNMTLIKVENQIKDLPQPKGNFITLDERRQHLAGIITDTVRYRTIIPASTLLGTVAIDEELVTMISSRVTGRIEKLYIKTSGEYLKKGRPVYSIYSEQLLADQKEFLALSENQGMEKSENNLLAAMVSASKNKLLLWGLDEKHIGELEKSKSASPHITFYTQAAGYVTNVYVEEGAYVETGAPLIQLTALHHVWIDAQVYSNEIGQLSGSKSFHVYADSYPDDVYTGRLIYHNPGLEDSRKVQLLRLRVDNAKNNLIPGMMVYVSPKQNTKSALAVSKSTVLVEKMKTVWVLAHENTFEQRMVETGVENKFWIEILSGLKEGEIVVSEGAYLISSEFILKSGAGQRHEH